MTILNKNKDLTLTHWFWIFALTHFLVWALVPALVRYNLPLDSMEGATWGHQLEWGYDKNPFLNAWLTALAIQLSPASGWVVYLLSQACMLGAFYAVWELGKSILPKGHALISVLLLETIQYYNLHGIDFNDNTLEVGLWALCSLTFYNALKSNRTRDWLLTGLFAGLGLMAKYYTLALIAAMGLLLLSDKQYRRYLLTYPPYLGLCFFLLIITPHVVWLFHHDFITIQYVFARGTTGHYVWSNHFIFPAKFAFEQLEVCLPTLAFFFCLFLGSKPRQEKIEIQERDSQFLLYVGLGPFVLTVLLSLFLGIYLRAGWGMPLMSLWGILLAAYLKPRLSELKIHIFIAMIFIFMTLLLTGYSMSLMQSDDESSANFPGREVAVTVNRLFTDAYHTPLQFVAGSRWVGGNISFYSKDHPAVYMEWNKKVAPWIDEEKMEKEGAVFVWSISDNETLPNEVKKRFPRLAKPIVLTFNWHRNVSNLQPIKIGVALLPPKQQTIP